MWKLRRKCRKNCSKSKCDSHIVHLTWDINHLDPRGTLQRLSRKRRRTKDTETEHFFFLSEKTINSPLHLHSMCSMYLVSVSSRCGGSSPVLKADNKKERELKIERKEIKTNAKRKVRNVPYLPLSLPPQLENYYPLEIPRNTSSAFLLVGGRRKRHTETKNAHVAITGQNSLHQATQCVVCVSQASPMLQLSLFAGNCNCSFATGNKILGEQLTFVRQLKDCSDWISVCVFVWTNHKILTKCDWIRGGRVHAGVETLFMQIFCKPQC